MIVETLHNELKNLTFLKRSSLSIDKTSERKSSEIIVQDVDIGSSTNYIQPKTTPSSPLELSILNKLQKLISGTKEIGKSWLSKGFEFNTCSKLTYGMIQFEGGPCGLLAAVQAFIIKSLFFEKGFYYPDRQQQVEGLILAMEDILERASRGKHIHVSILAHSNVLKSPLDYGEHFEFNSKNDVHLWLTKNISKVI